MKKIIKWAIGLIVLTGAVFAVLAAINFFGGGSAKKGGPPIPETKSYTINLDGGTHIPVNIPVDQAAQFASAAKKAVADSTRDLRPFVPFVLAKRIVGIDSVGSATPTAATASVAKADSTARDKSHKPPAVPLYERTLFVVLAVVALLGWWIVSRRRRKQHAVERLLSTPRHEDPSRKKYKSPFELADEPTESYFWVRLKFAGLWILLAAGSLAGVIYFGRPEVNNHIFFPLTILCAFSLRPIYLAFSGIPCKKGRGRRAVLQIPNTAQFYQKVFKSGWTATAVVVIILYLLAWAGGNF